MEAGRPTIDLSFATVLSLSTTLSYLSSERSRGSAVSLSTTVEAEEEHCRSIGLARDDKGKVAVKRQI
jgi:hypothetical protein